MTRFLLLVIALLVPACGYHLTANEPLTLPQDSTKLFLSKVTNPTTETWMVAGSAAVRRRLSRSSADVQTSQPQPITGTPWEVPVPVKIISSSMARCF